MGGGAACSGGWRCGTDAGGGAIGCGAGGGVVRSAGEDDRHVLCDLGDNDDGVELDAVTHGDHLDALDVVEVGLGGDGGWRGGRREGVGDVVGDWLLLGEGGEGAKGESEPSKCSTAERDHLVFLGPRRRDDGGGETIALRAPLRGSGRRLAGAGFGDCGEILAHGGDAFAARVGAFDEALEVDHPLGQVHLATELGEVGLDFCVLKYISWHVS